MNNYGNSETENRIASRRVGHGHDVNGRLASPLAQQVRPLPVPTLHGGQPDGAQIASAGRLLDPPAFDDFMDADGNALDYASVSRGW